MQFVAKNTTEPKEREDNTHSPGHNVHFCTKTFMRSLQGHLPLSSLISSLSLILAIKSSAAWRPVQLKAVESEPQGLSFISRALEKNSEGQRHLSDNQKRQKVARQSKHTWQMLRKKLRVLKQKRLLRRVERATDRSSLFGFIPGTLLSPGSPSGSISPPLPPPPSFLASPCFLVFFLFSQRRLHHSLCVFMPSARAAARI